jgi:hypothetical protein
MQNSTNNKPKIGLKVDLFQTGFTLLILSLGIWATLAARSEPILIWAGLPFLGIGLFLTGLLAYLYWSEWRVRVTASNQGLSLERILHDPTFFDPEREYDSIQFQNYRPRQTFAYILPHRERKNSTWALLMPEIERKATYPNGWRLVNKDGAVSETLKAVITEIAAEQLWQKHPVWLEIQCYPEKIQAIWDEGDREVARRLFEILSWLSEKAE